MKKAISILDTVKILKNKIFPESRFDLSRVDLNVGSEPLSLWALETIVQGVGRDIVKVNSGQRHDLLVDYLYLSELLPDLLKSRVKQETGLNLQNFFTFDYPLYPSYPQGYEIPETRYYKLKGVGGGGFGGVRGRSSNQFSRIRFPPRFQLWAGQHRYLPEYTGGDTELYTLLYWGAAGQGGGHGSAGEVISTGSILLYKGEKLFIQAGNIRQPTTVVRAETGEVLLSCRPGNNGGRGKDYYFHCNPLPKKYAHIEDRTERGKDAISWPKSGMLTSSTSPTQPKFPPDVLGVFGKAGSGTSMYDDLQIWNGHQLEFPPGIDLYPTFLEDYIRDTIVYGGINHSPGTPLYESGIAFQVGQARRDLDWRWVRKYFHYTLDPYYIKGGSDRFIGTLDPPHKGPTQGCVMLLY